MGNLYKNWKYNRSLRCAPFFFPEIVKRSKTLKVTAAAMGGTYEFAKIASANLREKNDSWNPAIGGFLAGSIMGLRC